MGKYAMFVLYVYLDTRETGKFINWNWNLGIQMEAYKMQDYFPLNDCYWNFNLGNSNIDIWISNLNLHFHTLLLVI